MKRYIRPLADFCFLIICGAIFAGAVTGLSAAADRMVTTKKADKGAITTPTAVAPPQSGGLSFGESVASSPAQQRRFLLKWAEMTQAEIDRLTEIVKGYKTPPPVTIVCKDSMCEDLALNIDNALESARWKSDVVIGSPFGIPPGISVSSKLIADAFNSATGGRYGAKVEEVKSADGEYILIGPKPRAGQ